MVTSLYFVYTVQVERRDASLGSLLGSLIQPPRAPGRRGEAGEDPLEASHQHQV